MESCEDLPPSRIWNLDETGMSGQVSGAKPKVLASKGYRANVQQSDSRENVSALVCGNADGGFVPPFIIFPGLSYDRTHTHGGYPNSKYASSPSSFLVTKLFVQYFEWFVNLIPPERPVLLIMDGYKAHFSVRTLRCARKHGILLYALPAHTSHFLQPMDVSVFTHFKRVLGVEIQNYQNSEKVIVNTTNIVAVAAKAFMETRTHFVAGFEKTGIYPLSREKMVAGIIGNQPAPAKKSTILLKPAVMISDRTTRKIVRSGDNVDSVRVASLNHWLMEERVMHKKPKRDINAQIVSGACLITSDESFEYHVAKSKEKADKLREKELRAQAKVAKTKERQDKKVAKLVANELKRREKIELTLAAEQKRIAVAEAKAAKRIAKAEAKEAKRIDDAEAKEAKRIARAEAKNIKRVADAEAKELKRIAQAAAKEAKRIATEEKRATAANAKKARHLTTILGTETTQSTGGVLSKKRQRFDSASESRPDLELKVDTYGDFHTNGEYEITF